MQAPFKVVNTGKGIKLVSHKYKGKHPTITHEPELDEFTPKDRQTLMNHVRGTLPCVSVAGKGIDDKTLHDLLNKSYEKERSDYGDYGIDRDLSSDEVQVYHKWIQLLLL